MVEDENNYVKVKVVLYNNEKKPVHEKVFSLMKGIIMQL